VKVRKGFGVFNEKKNMKIKVKTNKNSHNNGT
jgi:hypothetical protein